MARKPFTGFCERRWAWGCRLWRRLLWRPTRQCRHPAGGNHLSRSGPARPATTTPFRSSAIGRTRADYRRRCDRIDRCEETGNGVEVIRERFPNSTVKVERHVTQDAEGNYYNHGLWTEWDEKGRLVGSGEYRYGKRHGRWLRWYGPTDGAMLSGPLYKDFQSAVCWRSQL